MEEDIHNNSANKPFVTTLGRLFVIEGPDDVGKTTLSKMLWEYLLEIEAPTRLLSFPGNEPGTLGELVYRFYHRPQEFGVPRVSPIAMQLMVTSAHVEVIETRIKPLIQAGFNIVLDRFWWSTSVYAKVEGVPQTLRDKLIELELQIWGDIKPAVIFLVLRSEPFLEQPPNSQWNDVVSEYEMLYSQQQQKGPLIQVIRNEGTIDEALDTIISNLPSELTGK